MTPTPDERTTQTASKAPAPGGEIISEPGGAIKSEQRGGFVGIGTTIAIEERAFRNSLEGASRRLADHSKACGYSRAVIELEAADDAELAAQHELTEARPADLSSAHARADYLAAVTSS